MEEADGDRYLEDRLANGCELPCSGLDGLLATSIAVQDKTAFRVPKVATSPRILCAFSPDISWRGLVSKGSSVCQIGLVHSSSAQSETTCSHERRSK